ncbi:MAG: acyl-CoA thioesterase [bacterium]|nr:acyl-CoA thioesterase [bacterium]
MPKSKRLPSIRVLMMPRDTNPAGTIFGGVILSHMDMAGGEEAKLNGAEHVVTVAMNEVVFHKPVFVGDLVSYYTELVRIGRTSVTVRVSVEASRNWNRNEIAKVTEAEITYVNVDEERHPVEIRRDFVESED